MDSFNNSYQNGQQPQQNRGEHDFQKLSVTIETSIQKISQNVSSMQRMVNQLGTNQDSPELRKQLHNIQHYTRQLAKDTNGYIKELRDVPPGFSQSEQRQRKMQRERLQDEFTTTLNHFQAAQRSAARKEKEQVNKARAQAFGDPFTGGKKDQQLIELQDSALSRQQQQQQALQEEADLRALEEQEQSIRQLESDINDVNQIFKELGAMVHEQGEIVDSIEASVEHTEQYVSQGARQLREASSYKNKIRRKKVYLAIIAAAVLTVIILIIVWQVNN